MKNSRDENNNKNDTLTCNSITEIEEQFSKNVEDNLGKAEELNEFIACNPEISGEEYKAVEQISNLLNKEGFAVTRNFAGMETAFLAVNGENNHSRKVAILTEYDALPEIGHACGHSVSGSSSVLAGIALKDFQNKLDADIHIIGTPLEETDGGKITMAKKGVFDKYDMAIMLHMHDSNLINPVTLALDSYTYSFYGKAAHASAAPWDGCNAFNAAQLMFHAVDMLRQHVHEDVRMHGIIRYPGEAPNIVPEKCSLEMYCRAKSRKYLNEVVEKVDNCAKGAAIATGCTYKRELTDQPFDNLKSNRTGLKVLEQCYKQVGLNLNGDPLKPFGSTDAGNVSYKCPTFHGTIQLAPEGTPIHSENFEKYVHGDVANETIEKTAKIIGLQIIKIFTNDQLYNDMKKDFNEEL